MMGFHCMLAIFVLLCHISLAVVFLSFELLSFIFSSKLTQTLCVHVSVVTMLLPLTLSIRLNSAISPTYIHLTAINYYSYYATNIEKYMVFFLLEFIFVLSLFFIHLYPLELCIFAQCWEIWRYFGFLFTLSFPFILLHHIFLPLVIVYLVWY